MCCVEGSAGEKDLLRLCLFRGVLDDVHALTGRGPGIYCSWEILSGRYFLTTVVLLYFNSYTINANDSEERSNSMIFYQIKKLTFTLLKNRFTLCLMYIYTDIAIPA